MTAAYVEERVREVDAPAAVLWEVVEGFGGPEGFYWFDALWRARARFDRVVGGPGLRGRPDRPLRPGDAVDFWRVETVEPGVRLVLRAEMRMPGTPWLELGVEAAGGLDTPARSSRATRPARGRPAGDGERSRLVQRVRFEPGGPAGHLLWWTELAGHKLVFSRMCDGIAREAERRFRG